MYAICVHARGSPSAVHDTMLQNDLLQKRGEKVWDKRQSDQDRCSKEWGKKYEDKHVE